MLTSVGRVAVRRVAPSAQLICRQSAVATALPIRSFTASTWSSSPTASDKKPAKKTTTSTSTKKATGTTTATKSKSKATETKPKDKVKAKSKAKAAAEKSKPKKVVDPEKLKRLEIRELKKWALKDKPAQLPSSKWLLYMFEQRGNHLGAGGIIEQAKEMAEKFRQLSTSEMDDLDRRSSMNREKNQENYKVWLEAHEPARVHLANKCRRRLAFLTGKPEKMISDERLPSRPQGSYSLYLTEHHPGSTPTTSASEQFKILAGDWKQLSSAEKARYEEKAAEMSIKYKAEIEKLDARANAIQEAAEHVK
ncbi:uncharacterized protein FIESC28_02408 [Fusarium coffeatum]|uniref:HMG box domain-containing protein n=1 Tax=Fusarium coffeatum TaxID=231269 RepID=A0A366S817_9HYPO|nr:uncharacterized protein FIESC28_02408 [Fusarium coffeatum]RBR24840.1 hypothetical protein FIESC28_02408 [Fusarium coffeatum]